MEYNQVSDEAETGAKSAFEQDRDNYYKSRSFNDVKSEKKTSKFSSQVRDVIDNPDVDLSDDSDADQDLVLEDLREKEMKFVQEYLKSSLNMEIRIQPKKHHLNEVIIDHLIFAKDGQTGEIDHCYAKKICNKDQGTMILEIIQNDKVVFEERIQTIYHLFGMAKLDINPDYISYV